MKPYICSIASAFILPGVMLHAEPGDVSWELIRPSNTGMPGDFTQTIFVDDDDSAWIGGYVTFWEEGDGISTCARDLKGDEVLNCFNISVFLNVVAAGCP